MGCHTWFYRKIERTQEEAKQGCLSLLKRRRKACWEIYKNPEEIMDYYEGKTADFIKMKMYTDAKVCNRQIRMVSNNLCEKAVWNHQNDKHRTEYIEGKGLYINDTGFHNVFRNHHYPNVKLFSLKETLEYINNPENKCQVYDYTFNRLEEFWRIYPEGMILFG